MNVLRNRNVIVGVTGGIAAYKTPGLVRRLRERGAEVQVVMTRGAMEFVTPLTFQAVSGHPARTDLWDEEAEAAMGHIELARWADAIVVAPATADFMSRLAGGAADDLLATLCLASEAPLHIAPAMNRAMWDDPATQANRMLLADRGVVIIGPAEGDQACGETGTGRMLEPPDIVAAIEQNLVRLRRIGPLSGSTVLITAGPTRERIDPIRYLTNRSSGKMGFAVAEAAASAGADVVLIAGPVALETPAGVVRVDVESAEQMYDAVHEHVADADIFIGTAAVSDYRPATAAEHKIKKTATAMTLELTRTEDILASVSALSDGPFTVGFAAETDSVIDYAQRKLDDKNLDMIAANTVGDDEDTPLGFDADENQLTVLWRGGRADLDVAHKRVLARELMTLVAKRFSARTNFGRRKPA